MPQNMIVMRVIPELAKVFLVYITLYSPKAKR